MKREEDKCQELGDFDGYGEGSSVLTIQRLALREACTDKFERRFALGYQTINHETNAKSRARLLSEI